MIITNTARPHFLFRSADSSQKGYLFKLCFESRLGGPLSPLHLYHSKIDLSRSSLPKQEGEKIWPRCKETFVSSVLPFPSFRLPLILVMSFMKFLALSYRLDLSDSLRRLSSVSEASLVGTGMGSLIRTSLVVVVSSTFFFASLFLAAKSILMLGAEHLSKSTFSSPND